MISVDGSTKVFGIMGNSAIDSMLPYVHNRISEYMGINAAYVPFKVKGDLKMAVNGLGALDIKGVNVGAPYKTEIIYELAGVDPVAAEIGAVNTIIHSKDGYFGYNTEVYGLDRQLIEEKILVTGRHVLILGAGLAARTVAYLLISKNPATITIVNRTVSNAIGLQSDLRVYAARNGLYNLANAIYALSFKELRTIPFENMIAFQCTNVGLSPNIDTCVIHDRDFYKRISVGVDLLYNPRETMFMKYLKSAGADAHNGMKLLLYQAISSYELWNEITVPETIVYDIYKDLLENKGLE